MPIDGSARPTRLVPADVGQVAAYELTARGQVVYSDFRRLFAVPVDASRPPVYLTFLEPPSPPRSSTPP